MFVRILSCWDYRSLKMEWRLYQLGKWTCSVGDGERGKLSQKCFGDFLKHSRRRTIHKSFSFPSTWLEFWLLSLAMKCCIFKMGTVAWNHPSILSRFNSYVLSIPGLITFTFKALITHSLHLCRHHGGECLQHLAWRWICARGRQ